MRCLFIITNLRGGGAEKVITELATGLANRGHEMHLLLLEQLTVYDPPQGASVYALTRPGRWMSAGWLGKRALAYRLRAWYRRMTAFRPFDLAISALPFTDEVVHLARLPDVWHQIHTPLSVEIEALARHNPRKAARRLARYRRLYEGKGLIAVSKGVARDLSTALGLQHARIVTIYNPFDFAAIRRLAMADEPDLPRTPYLLHVGRFAQLKRHDLLIDAFAEAKLPHQLVLLTESTPALVQMIAGRGLTPRVTIAGFRRNPFPWMKHASALVLSSDREGLSNVLVEAIACGTPVVSTNCPSGPSEILTGPLRHYLVPCDNVAALARALQDVVETPPSINSDLLSQFSTETTLDKIESLARVAH